MDEKTLKMAPGMPGMSLYSWLVAMEECGLLDDAGPVASSFGETEARLCFVWSRMQFQDELREAQSRYVLTFIDFIEALACVAAARAGV